MQGPFNSYNCVLAFLPSRIHVACAKLRELHKFCFLHHEISYFDFGQRHTHSRQSNACQGFCTKKKRMVRCRESACECVEAHVSVFVNKTIWVLGVWF